jgi:hypothetical protein
VPLTGGQELMAMTKSNWLGFPPIWRLLLILGAAALVIYSTTLWAAYRFFVPAVLEIDGLAYEIDYHWRVDADYHHETVRFISLSRVSLVAPWEPKRRISVVQNVPLGLMPTVDNALFQLKPSPFGNLKVYDISAISKNEGFGRLSGSKFFGISGSTVVYAERQEDLTQCCQRTSE